MVYIAIDTCVWLDLIKVDTVGEINLFNELMFWIEKKHLTCITSKNLIDEWDRHKNNKKEFVKAILRDLHDVVTAFTGVSPLDSIYTAENIEQVIAMRIQRVDQLFKTIAEVAQETDGIYLRAAKRNLAQLPPNHIQDSFRDTVNYMTIAEHVRNNGYENCYFTTINKKDFSSEHGSPYDLHSLLKIEFEDAHLEYQFFDNDKRNVGGVLFGKTLRPSLPSYRGYIEDIQREKEKKKIIAFEAEKIARLDENDPDYLIFSQRIDEILNRPVPGELEELLLDHLFNKHPAYEKYFFRRLAESGSGKWFPYLKIKGFFNPAKNPKPFLTKEGRIAIAYWDVMPYLDKLSLSFANNELLELVPEILLLIENVSKDHVDNYSTWYNLLTVLSRIPPDLVPEELLGYMPVWVTSQIDNSVVTAVLVEALLPRFLNGTQQLSNRQKALTILRNLFTISLSTEHQELFESNRYYSPYDLWSIKTQLIDNGFLRELVAEFSFEEIAGLPQAINYLLRDHMVKPNFGAPTPLYSLYLQADFNDLQVVLEKLTENDRQVVHSEVIPDYLDKGRDWQDQYFRTLFREFDPIGEEMDIVLERAIYLFRNDFTSLLNLEPVSELQDNLEGNELMSTFALILRDWLSLLAIERPQEAAIALRELLDSPRYDQPYFRRIAIYTMKQNWQALREVFWHMVTTFPDGNLFSHDVYKVELRELLQFTNGEFLPDDVVRILDIIDSGPMEDPHYSNNTVIWQMRWLDAMKEHPTFEGRFRELSTGFDKLPDFSNEGRVIIQSGYESPVTAEEIKALENDELVTLLINFKTKDRRDGPDIEGLAHAFGLLVEEVPSRIANEIFKFKDVTFPYAYQLIYGLSKAAKQQLPFNHLAALQFCESYLQDPRCDDGVFLIKEEPGTKKEWIYGQVADLISEITKAFNDVTVLSVLPVMINLVLLLIDKLEKTNQSQIKDRPDFVMYVINSTQGKVLRAMIDVALQWAKLQQDDTIASKFHSELKYAFEDSFKREILDGYILIGMYLQQFMFLDESWLMNQISAFVNLPELEWAALMGGIAFRPPISNGEYYQLMLPLYQRAVKNEKIDVHHQSGILRHLLAFYFWHDEISFEDSLLYQVLSSADGKLTEQMITLVNQQKAGFKNLSTIDYDRLSEKIFIIWKFLSQRIQVLPLTSENGFKGIGRFISFVAPQYLNDNITDLIIDTVIFTQEKNAHVLFKELDRFRDLPETASYLARILASLSFNFYIEKDLLFNLMEFLYQNGQSAIANEIVTRLAQRGNDYLRPLYLKYNDNL
jgi:hypothetical protein